MIEVDPEREHFNFFNWHFGGYDRKQSDAGRQNYIPCNLGEIPDYYRRFIDPPEFMIVKTAPLDATAPDKFQLAGGRVVLEFDAAKGQMMLKRGGTERVFTKEK